MDGWVVMRRLRVKVSTIVLHIISILAFEQYNFLSTDFWVRNQKVTFRYQTLKIIITLQYTTTQEQEYN